MAASWGKVVLLDRDGTIIVDPPDERVDKIEKIALFSDTIEALQYLAEHDFDVVIVTNQAGVAEGSLPATMPDSFCNFCSERLYSAAYTLNPSGGPCTIQSATRMLSGLAQSK
jgi:histidinol phosphatase-like enzyme